MHVQEPALNAEQAAKLLNVDDRTVKRLAGRGELVGFRVGGRWRFRREAIDDYIRKQEEQQAHTQEEE